MDHADDGDDDDVFIYMGGDQRVPRDVTHVRIHKSVKIIRYMAFHNCRNLVSVEIHDGVEIIDNNAFWCCTSLKRIKLPSVRVIGADAFSETGLDDVDFGDKLETIGDQAFGYTALRIIKLPKVRVIRTSAFLECYQLTHVELSKDLEGIEDGAFESCPHLRRIAIPLKDNLLGGDAFFECEDLSQVDLVGGIHKTISSLLLDSWRNEMNDLIDRINQDLANVNRYQKTATIRQWMETVIRRVEHHKSEHYALLKSNMSQLELALWKANLHEEEEEKEQEEHPAKKARFEEPYLNLQYVDAARKRARVTCGANLIIPHVLSFLNDEDEFPTLSYNS